MRLFFLASVAVLWTSAAIAADVQKCPATIGLDTLYPPFQKHARAFSKNKIRVFNTDTNGEPVSCSKGLVIAFEEPNVPSSKCFYVGCFSRVDDITTASAIEGNAGLLIVLQAADYEQPMKPLKIRVNIRAGTVKIE
jgi:hypothetical protein